MKILVIGQRGQVARSLQEQGPANGVEIVTAGRLQFDLSDKTSVEDLISRNGPCVVVNAAAYTKVDNAESDEAAAYAVNAAGAAHVAEACAKNDLPLLHISTDYVFDGNKPKPYIENDAVAPINVYGRTKLAGERCVAAAWKKHLIIRTSWIYSPWESNFVLTMLRLARTRKVITIVDDQYGCPTYALHLANALIAVAARAVKEPAHISWGIYHAAGQGDATWCSFARKVFEQASIYHQRVARVLPISTTAYPTPASRPRNSRLDCRALEEAFGLTLPFWEAGVESCVGRVAGQLFHPSGSVAGVARSAE